MGVGRRNVYLHIGQIMQGSLSLTRGCGCGRKKIAFVLVVQNVHWRLSSKPPHVRNNVTTHPSMRLYKPQYCCLESDLMIVARLLEAVLHNRSTFPLLSVYNVFVQQNNASIYPIHCIYSSCDSRKNTLHSLVTMDLHSYLPYTLHIF